MKKENKNSKEKEEKNVQRSTFYYGFEIKEGNCYAVNFGRYRYYVRITHITETPNVVLAEDIYGKPLVIKLTKASMIMELSKEEFEIMKVRAERRRKKKHE